MNNVLVDSHTLIWLVFEPKRIGLQALQRLQVADRINISIVSLWELAVKYYKGKLAYTPEELLEGVHALDAELLQIKSHHILHLSNVKTAHKDPFDRMLLAQAELENLRFFTADAEILKLHLPYVHDIRK